MTTDHERLAGALPWYVADALDPAERRLVEEHLRNCAECRERVVDLGRFADMVGQDPQRQALEHVAPSLLVQYAEEPGALDKETRAAVEERLATCSVCRDALENLRRVEAHLQQVAAAAEPETERRGFWDFLSATILRPAPALAYLLVAAIGLSVLWFDRDAGPGSAIPEQIVSVGGDRIQREGPDTDAPPLEISLTASSDTPVLIELITDLLEEDVQPGRLSFSIELRRGERLLRLEHREATAFVIRDGRAALPLILEPGRIGLETPVHVIIRAVLPGDPLDGQALFTRSLLFREAVNGD